MSYGPEKIGKILAEDGEVRGTWIHGGTWRVDKLRGGNREHIILHLLGFLG